MHAAEFSEDPADFGHYQCNALLDQLDVQVQREEWLLALASHASFRQSTREHFEAEEETLFPAFERSDMGSLGSTELMRAEHRRMSIMMECMSGALAVRDVRAYLELSLQLRTLLVQHARKEDFLLEVLLGTRAPLKDHAIGS